MSYSINDSIKEAIGQVASDHELSAYAVMDLYTTVSDYVEDFLADAHESTFDDIEAQIVADMGVEDDEPADFGDPETLVADAEDFIDGCERADFLAQQYADMPHFLNGLRDRLISILADNG